MFMAFTFLPMFAAAQTATEAPEIGIIDFYTSPLKSIANLLIYGLYSFVTFILGKLVNLSASFMEWSLKLTMKSPEGIVNVGWGVSLGLANNLFILILLAIAIGTILGLPQINKKLLPMFLIIALLINFSMVIGNIVIDSSNVFASSFLNSIQKNGGAIGDQLMNSLRSGEVQLQLNSVVVGDENLVAKAQKERVEAAKNIIAGSEMGIISTDGQGNIETQAFEGVTPDTLDSVGVVLLKSIYIIFIQLVIIITFLFGGIYLLSRTFWLWLLLMLAPLAWIAKLIPKAEHYWDEWWSTFLAKAFFAPVYLFMVYLAVTIAKKSGSALSGALNSNGVNASAVIQMLTVAFLMMAGIHYGQKAGGSFANGVINYGKGLAGRYGKELKRLRSKGAFEKALEKVKPESLAKYTALGISRLPGAKPIAGFTPEKIKAELAKEKYGKIKENYESMTTEDLVKMVKEAQKNKQASPELAAAVNVLITRNVEERVALGGPDNKQLGELRMMAAAGLKGQSKYTYGTTPTAPTAQESKIIIAGGGISTEGPRFRKTF